MNRIRSKRKQAGISIKDISESLGLPWLIYLYFESRIKEMPLRYYVEVCYLLEIDLDRI